METKTRFTASPWTIHDKRIGPYRFMSIVAEDYPFCIADLVDSSTAKTLKVVGKDMRWDVFEANAALMVAAPEMYEMLRRIVGLDVMAAYWDTRNNRTLRESIESLLAKARGEEGK